jgi:hypothetical protein
MNNAPAPPANLDHAATRPSRLSIGRAAGTVRPLRVRTPADLVAIVPHLLGFQPADSLVLVFASRRGVPLTARLDLADILSQSAPDLMSNLLDSAIGLGSDHVVGVIYAPRRRAEQVRTLVESCLEPWLDLLVIVHRSRWWLAGGPASDPGEPVPRDTPQTLGAVAAGLTVAASRGALAELWAAPRGEREDELLALRQSMVERLTNWSQTASIEAMYDLALLAERGAGDGADGPSDEDYVTAALLVEDPAARDRLWCRLTGGTARAHLEFWIEVLRRTPVGHRALPLAVLALTAWQAGEGVIMSMCHDEAHALSPLDPVVRLVTAIRANILPPSTWREALAQPNDRHASSESLE